MAAFFTIPSRLLWVVKTLRFQLTVLDADDAEGFLSIATGIPGVVAAVVDEASASLDVLVSSDTSGLLVREQLRCALLANGADAVAA